jgi:hypothetical protein
MIAVAFGVPGVTGLLAWPPAGVPLELVVHAVPSNAPTTSATTMTPPRRERSAGRRLPDLVVSICLSPRAVWST